MLIFTRFHTALRRIPYLSNLRFWVWAGIILCCTICHCTALNFAQAIVHLIPLTILSFILSALALWPDQRPFLRNGLLVLAHSLSLITHGLLCWKTIDSPQMYTVTPCYIAAMQLICGHMGLPFSFQLLPILLSIIIPCSIYPTQFFAQPLPVILLIWAIALTAMQSHQAMLKMAGSGGTNCDDSKLNEPLGGGGGSIVLSPVSFTRMDNPEDPISFRQGSRTSQATSSVMARSLPLHSGSEGPAGTTNRSAGISSRNSISNNSDMGLLRGASESSGAPYYYASSVGSGEKEEVPAILDMIAVQCKAEERLRAIDQECPASASAAPRYASPSTRSSRAPPAILSPIMEDAVSKALAASTSSSTTFSISSGGAPADGFREASLSYDVLKEAYDGQQQAKEKAEDDLAKCQEDLRISRAQYAMMKGTYDSKEKEYADSKDMVHGRIMRLQKAESDAKLYKDMYDDHVKQKKKFDKDANTKFQDAVNLKMEYDTLKSAYDEREGKIESIQKEYDKQTVQAREMKHNYDVLAESTGFSMSPTEEDSSASASDRELVGGASPRGDAASVGSSNSGRKGSLTTSGSLTRGHQDPRIGKMIQQANEAKLKYQMLKKSHDDMVANKLENDDVQRQMCQEIRDANNRYRILKEVFDRNVATDQAKQKELVFTGQRLKEMELKHTAMKSMAESLEEGKRKFDEDADQQGHHFSEMKIKYDLLKESFDQGAVDREQVRSDMNKQKQEVMEMKRKYGVMKVRFDQSVEDAEKQKQQTKDMKSKYDIMKHQYDGSMEQKLKADVDLRQQQDQNKQMEKLYSTIKSKLDAKMQECSAQEEKIARAASQIKVLGWIHASNPSESSSSTAGDGSGPLPGTHLDALPDLYPALTSLEKEDTISLAQQQSIAPSSSVGRSNISSILQFNHDIQAPLNAAMSSLAILLDEKVILRDVDRRDLLQKAYSSLQTIASMMENISNVNKLRTRSIVAQPKPMNIRRLVIQVIRRFDIMARDVEMILFASCGVPTSLKGDRGLLQKVLKNLIEVALKANTETTRVTINLNWDAAQQVLHGTIVNHGNGGMNTSEKMQKKDISDDLSDEVLDKGDVNMRLTVSSQLLATMGGSLSVFNGQKGSLLSFQMPAPFSKNMANNCACPVKVVDDDNFRGLATMEMLKYSGATVLESTSVIKPTIVFITVESQGWAEQMAQWKTADPTTKICLLIPNHLFQAKKNAFPNEIVLRSPIDIVEVREVIQIFTGTCINSDASPTPSSVVSADGSRKQDLAILLMGNSSDSALHLKPLNDLGFYNVHIAFNAVQALELARINRYGLIILDSIHNHNVEALVDLIPKVRALPKHSDTPMVALLEEIVSPLASASQTPTLTSPTDKNVFDSSEFINKCRDRGLTDSFTKPLSATSWKTMIRMAEKTQTHAQIMINSSSSALALSSTAA